jgi:Tfp pilus assembly PilM family ATPase
MPVFHHTSKEKPAGSHRSFFDFFPAPKFLEMPAPGLALSDDGVRLVEFSHEPKGLVLKRIVAKTFPEKYLDAGNIVNREDIIRELGAFRKEHNLKYIRASLPEERAYLFSTEISASQSEDVRTGVEFIIEENVPLTLAESVFDYRILPNADQSSGRIKVSVSVLAESVVSEYLSIFRSAGLIPLHLEIESQAIAKAIIPKEEKIVSIIANVDCHKIGFYICDGAAVSFTSTIVTSDEGDDTITKNKNEGKACPPLSPRALQTIGDEIKKILLYWQTQADHRNEKARPIEKITIVGEGAGQEGLSDFLAKASGISVEEGNVWQNAFSLTNYIPEVPKNESLGYATAIGLALSRGR